MRRLENPEVATELFSLSGATTQEHLPVHNWMEVGLLWITCSSDRIVQTCCSSVGNRLRQAPIHPLPGPAAVLKIGKSDI